MYSWRINSFGSQSLTTQTYSSDKILIFNRVGGLVVGGCQEIIRQLKKQRDEEDRERRKASVQRGKEE